MNTPKSPARHQADLMRYFKDDRPGVRLFALAIIKLPWVVSATGGIASVALAVAIKQGWL